MERFVAKYKTQKSGCWEWQAAVHPDVGYGMFKLDGKNLFAHRVAWALKFGDIPPHMCVLHRCDNRLCVNPDHLFLGTRAVNQEDMRVKGRAAKGEGRPDSKLTEDDVRFIRSSDRTLQSLSNELGVSSSLISQVRRRVIWKHVT